MNLDNYVNTSKNEEYQDMVRRWLNYNIGSEAFERKVQTKKGFWDI